MGIRQAYGGGVADSAEELDEEGRLILANVAASGRLEDQEMSAEAQALTIEYLAERLDAETYRALVQDAALAARQPASG